MNAAPALSVTVDVAVRHGRTTARRRAQHVWNGARVDTVVASGAGVRHRRVAVREWRGELRDLGTVTVPADAPPPPPGGPDLPWDLLVGTGAALTEHRPDLARELLDRFDEPLRVRVEALRGAVVGRLRAVGVAPATRSVGWVSWLLLADGWHALVPTVSSTADGPVAAVRLEGRRPEDLASEVARWAAVVRR